MVFKSCCCFSLRSGAVILGWVGVPSYLAGVVLPIIGLFNIDYITKQTLPPNDVIDPAEWKLRVEVLIGLVLVISLINLISSVSMIIGAVSNNRFFLLPWLITSLISISFQTAVYISQISEFHSPPGTYVYLIVNSIIQMYFWLCVYSLFREIRCSETITATSSLISNKPSYSYNYQTI